MKRRSGFMLIKLLMVIAIIGLVSCIVFAASCDGNPGKIGSATKKEMLLAEDNQARLVTAVPAPRLTTSQERKNLVARLERFNTDSKVSYIYLVSFGKVMAFYTVKGKVSSVNSLLTTPDQVLYRPYRESSGAVLASPDLDGSYGSNGDAVFFFTTDGTYVEWSGDYMLCDKPLKLTTPAALVIQVEDS